MAPQFRTGAIELFVIFYYRQLFATGDAMAKGLAIATLVVAGVHWLWGMRDALTDRTLKHKEADNYFWFSLILLSPPLAAMMYYMLHDKRVSL